MGWWEDLQKSMGLGGGSGAPAPGSAPNRTSASPPMFAAMRPQRTPQPPRPPIAGAPPPPAQTSAPPAGYTPPPSSPTQLSPYASDFGSGVPAHGNPHWVGGDRAINRVNAFTHLTAPYWQNLLEGYRNDAMARQDPRAQLEFRQGQQDFIAQLQDQIAGKGVSAAQIQMNQALDRNLSNQAGLIGAMGGSVSPGAAQALLSRNQADLATQAMGQGSLLRAQESLAAQGQLGNVLATARGQDIAVQNQIDQAVGRYLEMGLSLDQAQFMANMEMEKLITQERMGNRAANAGGGLGQYLGPAASLVGAGIGAWGQIQASKNTGGGNKTTDTAGTPQTGGGK